VASTSVTYSQAKTKPSFTLWWKKDHTVFFAAGAVAESKTLDCKNTDATDITFSGGFMQRGWAGTSAVSGALSAVKPLTVTTGEGKFFTADAYVQIGDDTNSDAGYKIASVSGDVLTMADNITCDDAVVIKGYLPTHTRVGAPIENKNLGITLDGTAKVLKSLSVDYKDPVAWQTDEITSSGYVESYVEDERSITMSLSALFREKDLGYMYDSLNNTKTAVIATISDGAGKICTFNYPYVELDMPKTASSSPTVSIDMTGTALGSTGEDSSTAVFT
jgi:hypothetical protein